jgi:hypothetical protein
VERTWIQDTSVDNCFTIFTGLLPSLRIFSMRLAVRICFYVLAITYVGEAGTRVFLGIRREGRKNAPILIGKTLSLNLGFYEIRSVGDLIQLSFGQLPLTLGTLALDIGPLCGKGSVDAYYRRGPLRWLL